MSDFLGAISQFALRVQTASPAVFVRSVELFHGSVVDGSQLTGAPPLPVDTGNLRNSVQVEFVSATEAIVSTNVEYAPYVEDNVRGVTFHNGGPHGWKRSIAGFPRLVEQALIDVGGGG